MTADSNAASAQRHVGLEGGSNFRDIGGYPTADGRTVRWGRVYRSATLNALTPADVATIEALGLRVVYDLRALEESEASPSILPEGLRVEQLPIGGSAANIKGLSDLVVDGKLTDIPDDFLMRVYSAMIDSAAPTFGRLLTGLADPDGLPALFHCTAGKDRTGMVAALLLSVLGVDDETILDDYVLSATHYSQRQMAKLRARAGSDVDVDRYRIVFDAPRDSMAAALGIMRSRHGSLEGYLRDEGSLTDATLDQLRTLLLV